MSHTASSWRLPRALPPPRQCLLFRFWLCLWRSVAHRWLRTAAVHPLWCAATCFSWLLSFALFYPRIVAAPLQPEPLAHVLSTHATPRHSCHVRVFYFRPSLWLCVASGRPLAAIGRRRPHTLVRRYFGPASRPLCVCALPTRSPIARHRPLLFACALARLFCGLCCLLLSFGRSFLPARLCARSFGPLLPSCRLS